jgi:hypothetical protein
MVKARVRKSVRRDDGRKNKASADARDTTESALPPKKPPAPSAKHRLKRGRRAKLLK